MPKTKARRTTPSEREVLAGVLDAMVQLGIEPNRQNTGAMTNASGRLVRFGKPGNADISTTIPRGPNAGKRLEVECKRPGKRPTPEQWKRIHEVNAAGGISFWTDDPAVCFKALRRLLEGWRVEIDDAGNQFVTDVPRKA